MGISPGRIGLLVALFALVVIDALVIGVRHGSTHHSSSPAAALVQTIAPSSSPAPASVPPVATVPPAPVVTPSAVAPSAQSKRSASGFRSVAQRALPPGSRLVTDSKGRFEARMYGTPLTLHEPATFGPVRFSIRLEVTHDPIVLEVEGIQTSQPVLQDFKAFAGSSLGSYGDSSGAKELGHKVGTFRGSLWSSCGGR